MSRRAFAMMGLLLIAAPARGSALLMEIWINGRDSHIVARVTPQDGKFAIANADMADAGIAVARSGTELLDSATSIRAEADEVNQRLLITVNPARLILRSIDLRPSFAREVTPAGQGAMLGYDLSATTNDIAHAGGTTSAGGSLALTLFSGNARMSATGFDNTGLSAHGALLDTALEFDTPSAPRRLVFGDAISGVPDWGRSVRFGGIELATDFTQQPDRITVPLPDYFGMAALPSTADVFVGAARVFEADVDEGPFALQNLPVLTGGGGATVVVHDVLGREITQTVSLYTDPSLLADGLTDYALDGGFLRRQYGIASADYAVPFASGTWRHGFSGFTADAHAEFAQHLAMSGGGVGFNLGSFGMMSGDGAVSHDGDNTAFLGSAHFGGQFGPLSINANIAQTSGRFADIASQDEEAYPRLRYQAGVSAAAGRDGSLALSWIGERQDQEPVSDLITASYSLSFGGGFFLGLTGLRNLSARTSAAELFFSIPLGAATASASASFGGDRPSFEATYDAPANPDGGFGYRALLDSAPRRAEADATWIGDEGEIDGAVSRDERSTALRADASGGVVLLGGDLFATRQPSDAVALVDAGAPDVRIYQENRDVAVSGADGKALITGLAPYTANHIAVDARDYPMNADVAQTERVVVPPRGTGVIVDLAPAARRSFVAVIRLSDGSPPPVGSLVTVKALLTPLLVGHDGEVFFGDLRQPSDAEVDVGARRCHVRIAPPSSAPAPVPRVGPLICHVADAS